MQGVSGKIQTLLQVAEPLGTLADRLEEFQGLGISKNLRKLPKPPVGFRFCHQSDRGPSIMVGTYENCGTWSVTNHA